ncbi:MAG: methyltransferase domain-containing protein [Kineosporiaceae bacterium]
MTTETPDSYRHTWDADAYAEAASFVPVSGRPLLEALPLGPGVRVLDLGCGDGVLTAEIAAAGAEVVGVDASPEMVAAARAKGLDARLADAAVLPEPAALGGEFDAVLTNAVLHWVPDTRAVLDGVRRVLRPGGVFVGEFGGLSNVAAIGVAADAVLLARGFTAEPANPWFFPGPQRWAGLLAEGGFDVRDVQHVARPTPLPSGLLGWLELFGDVLLQAVPEEQRPAVREEIVQRCRPWLCDTDTDGETWVADYVRMRFRAVRA